MHMGHQKGNTLASISSSPSLTSPSFSSFSFYFLSDENRGTPVSTPASSDIVRLLQEDWQVPRLVLLRQSYQNMGGPQVSSHLFFVSSLFFSFFFFILSICLFTLESLD